MKDEESSRVCKTQKDLHRCYLQKNKNFSKFPGLQIFMFTEVESTDIPHSREF